MFFLLEIKNTCIGWFKIYVIHRLKINNYFNLYNIYANLTENFTIEN